MIATVPDAPVERRRRRGRIAAITVGGLAAVTIAGTATVGYGGSKADPGPLRPPTPSTTKISRTTLVEGKDFKGELEYAEPAPLTGRLSGTVTGLPSPGTILHPGDTAYTLDKWPVVLMAGQIPAYRPLMPGNRGEDIRQFEENLRSLGFSGFTGHGKYTAATAVMRWQERLGLKKTGVVELGRVIFRPKPLRIGALRVHVGDLVGNGPVYETTSTDRRVILSMTIADRTLAPKGWRATVTVPGGRDNTRGVVSEVVPPAGGEDPKSDTTPKFEITIIKNQKVFAGYDEGPVDVRLVVSERKDILTVPIAALLALDGDRYGVETVYGSQTRTVPVTIGLFAQGRVEISGEGGRRAGQCRRRAAVRGGVTATPPGAGRRGAGHGGARAPD